MENYKALIAFGALFAFLLCACWYIIGWAVFILFGIKLTSWQILAALILIDVIRGHHNN